MYKIFFTTLFISVTCYAQNVKIGGPLEKDKVFYHCIDGLSLNIFVPGGGLYFFGNNMLATNEIISSFKFREKDIESYKYKDDSIFIKTKLVFVIDSLVLIKNDDKIKYLTSINQKDIISIERIDNNEAFRQYGKLGKKGVIKIITNH